MVYLLCGLGDGPKHFDGGLQQILLAGGSCPFVRGNVELHINEHKQNRIAIIFVGGSIRLSNLALEKGHIELLVGQEREEEGLPLALRDIPFIKDSHNFAAHSQN